MFAMHISFLQGILANSGESQPLNVVKPFKNTFNTVDFSYYVFLWILFLIWMEYYFPKSAYNIKIKHKFSILNNINTLRASNYNILWTIL